MYINQKKDKNSYSGQRKRDEFLHSLGQSKRQEVEKIDEIPRKKLESPHDMLLAKHFERADLHWRAMEFEMFERDKKWYVVVLALLILIVAYAIYMNGLIMAITFILIGIVGYMYINKEPRELDFAITEDGIITGKEIYTFKILKSFWIFDDPDDIQVISVHTDSYLNPYLHIPIGDQNTEKIREILSEYIPEEKHAPGFLETLDRFLRL